MTDTDGKPASHSTAHFIFQFLTILTQIHQYARRGHWHVDEEEAQCELNQQNPQQHHLEAVALRVGAELACLRIEPKVSRYANSEDDEESVPKT